MKIKLLIICLCVVVAAVGGKMSVDFTNTEKSSTENSSSPNEPVNNLELSKISESANEK